MCVLNVITYISHYKRSTINDHEAITLHDERSNTIC